MKQTYMRHWGQRYVRSSSGRWYAVHGREGTWVTNRYGTTFYRSGSEVWRDITASDQRGLERELHRRTQVEHKEMSDKYKHWGMIVETMAKQSIEEDNEHTAQLAEMLEALRQQFFGQKVQQLSTTLDETAVKD